MLSDAGSIRLYEQKFRETELPESGDTSEEGRLRAAVTGVYELNFRQQPQYEFSGVFLFNDEKPASQRGDQPKQFAVSEDITEAERTLTIQSTAQGIKLDSLEIIPLDWRENPIEFTQLEGTESQRKICYRKDAPVESLKLKLSSVNVFEVETINAVLWANGRDYSPGKLATLISRSEDMRIDNLDNSRGGVRRLEEHLLTFFRILLENAPDRTFDIECSYRYYPVAGAPHVLVPVLFQKSLNLMTAAESFSTLMPTLSNWYQSVSPPKGVFNFGVKVDGAGSRESIPVIQFTGLILPIESIMGWSDASSK